MKTTLYYFVLTALLTNLSLNIYATQMTVPVRSLDIFYVAPEIIAADGIIEAAYGASQSTEAFNVTGSTGADADFTLSFQACANYEKLWLFFTVLDDYACEIPYTTSTNQWTWDNVEVFLSLDTTGTVAAYDTNTIQLRFNRGLTDSVQTPGRATQEEYELYFENTADGYIIEVGIPWTAVLQVGAMPEDIVNYINPVINGFDVHGADNDTDGAGARDCQTAWDNDEPAMPDATEDLAWNNRNVFGIMKFVNFTHLDEEEPWIIDDFALMSYKAYPNPSKASITFQGIEPSSTLIFVSMMGEKVCTFENVNPDENIDISMLKPGIYVVRVGDYGIAHVIKE